MSWDKATSSSKEIKPLPLLNYVEGISQSISVTEDIFGCLTNTAKLLKRKCGAYIVAILI